MSERRSVAPFGMAGGSPGAKGVNYLLIKRALQEANDTTNVDSYRTFSLGGKSTVEVKSGDRIKILTPAGGGYGPPGEGSESTDISNKKDNLKISTRVAGGSLLNYQQSQETA